MARRPAAGMIPAMTEPDWRRLLAFADELADLARPIARRWFRTATATLKGDRTPVTEADTGIEQALRAAIRARHPDHGIRGEEQAHENGDAELCWVLDPIDGTKAFATGNPLFGTLIGLCWQGRPVLGVMDCPALGERWRAAPGFATTHNGTKARVRAPRPLGESVLYCTTPDPMRETPGFPGLRRQVAFTVFGGDCVAYGLVALGHADLLVDRGLKAHDFCALVPILEQAGGVLLDWRREPLTLQSDGAVVAASHRALADAALALVLG